MPATVFKVTVYEASPNEYKVHPPLITLNFAGTGAGTGPDELVIANDTDDDLVMYINGGALHASKAVAVPLAKRSKSAKLPVMTQGGGNSNLFTYHVLVPKTGKKAKGNSDPVLIIEN